MYICGFWANENWPKYRKKFGTHIETLLTIIHFQQLFQIACCALVYFGFVLTVNENRVKKGKGEKRRNQNTEEINGKTKTKINNFEIEKWKIQGNAECKSVIEMDFDFDSIRIIITLNSKSIGKSCYKWLCHLIAEACIQWFRL